MTNPEIGTKSNEVRAWVERVVIPTYEPGKPEKNPMFLEKRVYQGSSGSVYPHPVIEKLSDVKVDKEWLACWLENEYVKIMILPELGGRVQMAYDKIKQRHFVYYNQVIKPALVGLTGPWISGGIEFNWPQHHRPGTWDPVDYRIEEHTDGSKTVWCSEIERMYRTKGMAGFRLYPQASFLEINVRLYNRTPQPQTFLWWANPAVAVNDDYQSVFPPDVHAVFDHGRRDVSRFPIATGTYYKVDYSAGVDISRYRNIPVPTSYMAVESKYEFLGGYEHDTQGGMLHVANRHVSTGKKQWTWGHGDFGKAWDRNLTDCDGPYIELMCGVYCDNQPDFSWLMPYEEKSFTQYFMPYRDIGVVKNATREAMVNLEFLDGHALVRAFTTGRFPGSHVILDISGVTVLDRQVDLHPATSFRESVAVDPAIPHHDFKVSVVTDEGRMLVSWRPETNFDRPIPEPAKAAKDPSEIASAEQLFLTGQHLEQYRHATFDPEDYYREAIKRDPGDIRCNNALGLRSLRKGCFAEAAEFFRVAVATLTDRNPNPYDGEPLFNLGMALRYQDRDEEAFSLFYKAVWNAAWMDAGYFQLARIAAGRRSWAEALDLVNRSIARNTGGRQALHLKAVILRNLGRMVEFESLIKTSLECDSFQYGLVYEASIAGLDTEPIEILKSRDLAEYALDYYWAGQYDEAIALLDIAVRSGHPCLPLLHYWKGWILAKKGDTEKAIEAFRFAETLSPDYCFPNQLEAVPALGLAMKMNPDGAKAPYYLGNFWYHAKQYQRAAACWEQSVRLDDTFPTVHRNLALAWFNKFNAPDKAREAIEKAFSLDTSDSRILMELDQLYKKLGRPPEERLAFLEKYPEQILERDDLYLERITLCHNLGQHEYAYHLLMVRKFHPWEGGEGKVTGQYRMILIAMARKAIDAGKGDEALGFLESAQVFPENLGEGKLPGAVENDIDYYSGCAFNLLGRLTEAHLAWEAAARGTVELKPAWYYNDQPPEMIYYKGLSLASLCRKDEALSCFKKLIAYGEKHMHDPVRIEYFAVSLPDLLIWEEDLFERNRQHCLNLIRLGKEGMSILTDAD
jgi:tetratricopeptide (TPR) repeat protein